MLHFQLIHQQFKLNACNWKFRMKINRIFDCVELFKRLNSLNGGIKLKCHSCNENKSRSSHLSISKPCRSDPILRYSVGSHCCGVRKQMKWYMWMMSDRPGLGRTNERTNHEMNVFFLLPLLASLLCIKRKSSTSNVCTAM